MLPHDFKNYRAPSAFSVIDEDVAELLLVVLLIVAFLFDRMGWLA
jgi:hypothetical protein